MHGSLDEGLDESEQQEIQKIISEIHGAAMRLVLSSTVGWLLSGSTVIQGLLVHSAVPGVIRRTVQQVIPCSSHVGIPLRPQHAAL